MPRLSPLWIALACAAAATPHTFAQPAIWRCGNSYSDRPCEGGRLIGAPASPSEEERLQAEEGTRRDQQAAQRMQRERLRLEANAPRGALVISPPASAETARSAASGTVLKPPKVKKPQKPDAFVASHADPAAKKAGKKSKKKTRAEAAAAD